MDNFLIGVLDAKIYCISTPVWRFDLQNCLDFLTTHWVKPDSVFEIFPTEAIQ